MKHLGVRVAMRVIGCVPRLETPGPILPVHMQEYTAFTGPFGMSRDVAMGTEWT